jgi:protein-disulfide isomerase
MTLVARLRGALALAFAIAAVLVALPTSAWAAPLTDAEKDEIRALVKDYLKAHPEVILEALDEYQAREKAKEAAAATKAIADNRARILSTDGGGVAGNPKGDVTLVEFFDYRCGYCRQAKAIVADFLKADPNVRLVYKEFPILGPDSVTASRAALASRRQGDDKYLAFHDALMNVKGSYNEEVIIATARQVGLDTSKLLKDMEDPAIEATIKQNRELAHSLGIEGTPSFVIGNTLVPGVADVADLKTLAAQARKECAGTC